MYWQHSTESNTRIYVNIFEIWRQWKYWYCIERIKNEHLSYTEMDNDWTCIGVFADRGFAPLMWLGRGVLYSTQGKPRSGKTRIVPEPVTSTGFYTGMYSGKVRRDFTQLMWLQLYYIFVLYVAGVYMWIVFRLCFHQYNYDAERYHQCFITLGWPFQHGSSRDE